MITFKKLLERLFHFQKWLPPDIEQYIGKTYPLRYTRHAMDAAQNDRYNPDLSKIPRSVKIEKNQIIEVETNDSTGKIRKFVVRKPYDDRLDISLVFVVPEGDVKTLWFNLKSDTHRTIDLSRYANAYN